MYTMNRLRFGGLASGLDTDSIVNDLMKIEQMKVDKLKQERQVLEWRKDDYRSTSNLLRGFYDEYFDILYSNINMTSANTYNTLKVQSSNDKYLTATASAGAYPANKTITEIKMATAARVEGGSASALLQSGELIPNEEGQFDLSDQFMVITIDGTTKMIEFHSEASGDNGKYDSIDALKEDFQNKINEAFGYQEGQERVIVEISDTDENRILLNSNSSTSTITVNDYVNGGSGTDLGFIPNQSNRVNLDSTLLGLQEQFDTPLEFDEDGNAYFTINGVELKANRNETLRTVINRINKSDAEVNITYSSLTDQFAIANKNTGVAHTLTFQDGLMEDSETEAGGNFLKALGLVSDEATNSVGEDAKVVIDGMTVYRSTNNFTIDGITYNLTHDFKLIDGEEPITLTMTKDVDQAFDNIKSFVESYNKIIDTINGTLSQEKFKDFPPLTDEQREAMSEKDIELWEKKAKSGLLQRDSILQKIVYDMRRALVDSVKDSDINLSSIGITTGSYTENGRLNIDEKKLKDSLRENGDGIMALFSNKSEISYSPDNNSDMRSQRYEESGLVHRLSDILQDNIRTSRDKDGRKGTLLEKAGIVGDASENVNLLEDQLKDMNKRIDDAIERMYRAENRYWAQFTALETALQQMNSQSMWLSQQLGGGMY